MDEMLAGLSLSPLWVLLGLSAAIATLLSSIAVVRGEQVAVVERRWIGRRMSDGRVVASGDQVGIQARVLAPGLHLLAPFLYAVSKVSMVTIDKDEVGLVDAIDGRPLPPGRIFAAMLSGHDHFQDGEAFLHGGGERGPQLEVLPPGVYRINPHLFRVRRVDAVDVPAGKVGVVVATDGASMPSGRLLARKVDAHDNFQDGQKFLTQGGEKGPQIDLLLPGRYRINTTLFEVTLCSATVVPTKRVGIVTAKDGQPLPATEYVAKLVEGHGEFQDAATFLMQGGQRGPQLGFLRPGVYYVNPLMFEVELERVAEVERGHVAVIVSNVGLDPSELGERATSADDVLSGVERYVVDAGYRGIQREVAGPGTYYLNKLAYIPHILPTTNITIDWADDRAASSSPRVFNPLSIVSKDGFEMTISVKVIIRVLPEQAPHMVARIGTIENLIEHVLRPLIDSSFRNQASSSEAMKFMQDRHEEQKKAEVQISRELAKYHVRCVSVLICQIILPERLMETLTNKVVAAQQMSMFDAQREAEERRRDMENTRAQANLQPSLVKSQVDVQIASQKKQEMVTLAEGKGISTRLEQEGIAAGIAVVGQAEGAKILAVGQATGEAYALQAKALGQVPLAGIEVMKAIAQGHVRITPDVLVAGGGQSADAGIVSAFVANLMARSLDKPGA